MIISCIKCSKKFTVNSDLIPDEGRTIQCGSCDHVWFFKKNNQREVVIKEKEFKKDFDFLINDNQQAETADLSVNVDNPINKKINKKKVDIFKKTNNKNFTIGRFLSYLIVLVISFIAIIIFLDTFKNPLEDIFPDLEFLLFSLFETLKDVYLFVRDLF